MESDECELETARVVGWSRFVGMGDLHDMRMMKGDVEIDLVVTAAVDISTSSPVCLLSVSQKKPKLS